MCISRATVSAVSCLVVPAFICIDLLISLVLKINDDDDDDENWNSLFDGSVNSTTFNNLEKNLRFSRVGSATSSQQVNIR